VLKEALKAHQVNWQSFRDKRPGKTRDLGRVEDPRLPDAVPGRPPGYHSSAVDRCSPGRGVESRDRPTGGSGGAEAVAILRGRNDADRIDSGAALARILGLGFGEGRQQTGFLDRVYKEADGYEVKYVVFLPRDYDARRRTRRSSSCTVPARPEPTVVPR